jgi:hypothetical protein
VKASFTYNELPNSSDDTKGMYLHIYLVNGLCTLPTYYTFDAFNSILKPSMQVMALPLEEHEREVIRSHYLYLELFLSSVSIIVIVSLSIKLTLVNQSLHTYKLNLCIFHGLVEKGPD